MAHGQLKKQENEKQYNLCSITRGIEEVNCLSESSRDLK